jgi:hypothetical protein
MRDEELIRDPAIRRAVAAHHAATSQPTPIRSRRWPTGWLILIVVIGVLAIVLIGWLRLAG